ncbi:ligand-effect modulator 3 family [Phascolomyces articulosus]|uniref:Ligand-effect modulator 3 family n=1 Tax=Phascolomyces articulosus TaxID=60185 RepID=A0AAD5P877_9FUNG|nr:ligand-effect modulator 3 family [Phascolomyces articulosus]
MPEEEQVHRRQIEREEQLEREEDDDQDEEDEEEEDDEEEEPKKSRKPFKFINKENIIIIDGAFRQQRLPAWQPVLTPRSVLPAFFIMGIIFLPIGGLLYWNNGKVDEIMINYSYCRQYENPVYLAPNLYSYLMSKEFDVNNIEAPAYHYQNVSEFMDEEWSNPNNLTIPQCVLDFTIPSTMQGPIYMYYRLTNFYQNHRLYIKNFDAFQLLGDRISPSTLNTNCGPLDKRDGQVIYPCGLVANSMFNDTASNLTSITSGGNYTFTTKGIAWPEDFQKYSAETEYALSELTPPPNWALRYPNGKYDEQHPPPNLKTMERLMVWMHMAALPDFRKIWARNDYDDLPAGRWRVHIDLNFETLQYQGTKWIVLSNTTPLGGRNPYIGIAYLAIGGLCVLVGLVFTLAQLIKPRKLGDKDYLSWHKEGGGLPTNKRREKLEKNE